MRRLLYCLLSVTLVFMTCVFAGCRKSDADEFVIGAILPLTGKSADSGNSIKAGLECALDEIKAQGGRRIAIYYYDNASDSKNTVVGYMNLRNRYGIKCVYTTFTDNSFALKPLAIQDKVLLMAIASNKNIGLNGENLVYRLCNSNDDEVSYIIDYFNAQTEGMPLIVFAQNTDAGMAYKEAFDKQFRGKLIGWNYYDDNVVAIKSLIASKMSHEVKKVAVFGYSATMGSVIKALREFGYDGEIISNPGFYNPSVLQLAGEAAVGVKYLDYDLPYETRDHEVRNKKAQQQYRTSFTLLSYLARLSIKLICSCAQEADFEQKEIGRKLSEPHKYEFDGIEFETTDVGSIKSNFILKEYKGN